MDAGLISVAMASALVGLSAAGLGGALYTLRRDFDPLRRRLRSREAPAPLPEAGAPAHRLAPRALRPLAKLLRGSEGEVSQLRRRLNRAGLRSPAAPGLFLSAKVALALSLPLSFLAIHSTLSEPLKVAGPLAVWLCAGGFFLPNLWLSSKVQARRQLIERALPDALDLLVTCVEAGQGLDAALLRVSGDSALSSPVLADELNLAFLEIKAGIARPEAFRRLYDRTGADELKSLAATLAQAEMFGTSVGVALRVQAAGMRVRRMLSAEERAAVVAVKMSVPLVLCILPSLLAIVMGPAALNIYRSLYSRM